MANGVGERIAKDVNGDTTHYYVVNDRIINKNNAVIYQTFKFYKKEYNIEELRYVDDKPDAGSFRVYCIADNDVKRAFTVPHYYKCGYELKKRLRKLED